MIQDNLLIIGLTGSVGSGCSTLYKVLMEAFHFKGFKISDEIRSEAIKKSIKKPDRNNLQDIGNEFREKHGNTYWINRVLSNVKDTKNDRLVIDGIKNLGEVATCRKYPGFFLVAMDCSIENRWERLKSKEVYKGNRLLFEHHDRRDKDEGLPYGQQVLRCVEEADIIFINEEQFPTEVRIKDEIKSLFNHYLLLLTGEKLSLPNIEDTVMAVASNLALQSRCLKRRVGAVLCSKDGFIISAAYNEVPPPGKSCIEEYGMCYRDFFRNKLKQELGVKFLPPSIKALDKCRALHAEEVVILRTPQFLINESTLYTTTFPCLQCAKRILHVGIREVIYIDPYPEEEAIKLLEQGGVKTKKFGGVKAQAFYKLFYPHREWLERKVRKRLKKNL